MGDDKVSLREYFEKIIELQQSANERALGIQRDEMERRLEGLNELRKQVTEDRSEFVKREVFELSVKEVRNAVVLAEATVDKRLRKIEDEQSRAQTRIITWISAIGLFLLAVEIAMKFLTK